MTRPRYPGHHGGEVMIQTEAKHTTVPTLILVGMRMLGNGLLIFVLNPITSFVKGVSK